MSFVLLKYIHITCATLTISLYCLRGIWMMRESTLFNHRWSRRIPPIIDSTLLLTGIYMTTQIQQYPFTDNWLTAKILALLAYIIIGIVGFRARTKKMRTTAWLIAIMIFVYIALVARTHNPLPFVGIT
jgi:uncharacterized membrane protein SirB2